MCGILGIYGDEDVFPELAYGMTTLQHRGQDSAGIVTFDYAFHIEKGEGLASQIFVDDKATSLKGPIGLGHIRYTTQGDAGLCNAQPFMVNYPFGLAMVHNGNVTNFEALKQEFVHKHFRLLQSSNDIELILDMLALELERKNLPALTVEDIFSAVKHVQEKVHGAYATLTLIANRGMLAFMDPNGIRPLLLGRKETEKGPCFAFASESTCLDYLGYDVIHNLEAGEAVFIDSNKKVHTRICHQKKKAFCVFEYVYFAKEDSKVHGRLVAAEREKMGKALAKSFKEQGLEPDIVIDVPSSAYFCAQGLADALGVPYKRALVKNNHANRSFISPTQKLREKIVKRKLNTIKSVIEGKKVAVVDDSIVRGTTSKHIVSLLRKAGAKEVYFASGSPPLKHPCVYGIDMSTRKEMIAAKRSLEDILEFIGADALVYLKIEDLRELYSGLGTCDACFSGEYPSDASEGLLEQIERDKTLACR